MGFIFLEWFRLVHIPFVSMVKFYYYLGITFSTQSYLLYRSLSGATIRGHSGPGSISNEGVLRIPQMPSISGTSPSDCLVSYPGHSLGVLPFCRCILLPQPTGQVVSYLMPNIVYIYISNIYDLLTNRFWGTIFKRARIHLLAHS